MIIFGPWVLKFGKRERGRAANRSEFGVWSKASPKRRELLCPSLKLIRDGYILIAKRAERFRPGEMTLELYIKLGTAWMNEPPFDDSPFEPKDDDWGWIDGKPVAMDYALTQAFLKTHYPAEKDDGAQD